MHSSGFLTVLALQAACIATATPLAPRTLNFDEVAVVGLDGKMAIMHENEYNQLKARHLAELKPATKASRNQLESSPPKLRKRDCEQSEETQILSDTSFTDADVAMSAIYGAQGGSTAITVAEGYSLAQKFKIVTGGTIKTAAKAVMKDAYNIDTDVTWTTTQESTLKFTVPEGQYGLVVSQPLVRRLEGTILSGCTDAPVEEAFTLDSYSSQSFGALSWVQGVIRLCNSTVYPVPYCSGEGSHE